MSNDGIEIGSAITRIVMVAAVVAPLAAALAPSSAGRRERWATGYLALLAALPVALLPLLPTLHWSLPAVLLGTELSLAGPSRAVLWLLAPGWLLTTFLVSREPAKFRENRLLLLSLSMTVVAALASESLLYFAGSTLASYALLGWILGLDNPQHVHNPTSTPALKLGVTLVVTDLLLFEFLLLLADQTGTRGLGQPPVATESLTTGTVVIGSLALGPRLLLPVILHRARARGAVKLAALAVAIATTISVPLRLYTPTTAAVTVCGGLAAGALMLSAMNRVTAVSRRVRASWPSLDLLAPGSRRLNRIRAVSWAQALRQIEEQLARWPVAIATMLLICLYLAGVAGIGLP